MAQAVEMPTTTVCDDGSREQIELAGVSVISTDSFENPEDISEDWVALFLDPSILDEQASSLPSDFVPYPSLKCTLEDPDAQISSEDLLSNFLLPNSTDDQISHSESILASSLSKQSSLLGQPLINSAVPEDSIQVIPPEANGDSHERYGPDFQNALRTTSSSSCPVAAPSLSSTFPPAVFTSDVPCAPASVPMHSSTASQTSSLTRLSGDSTEPDGWLENEVNPGMLVMLKRESPGDTSSGSESPTSPSNAIFGGEICFPHNSPPASNPLQSSSFLLQCEEGGVGATAPGNEVVANSGSPSGNEKLQSVSELESFGMRHLHGIGSAIKAGLLGRSGDRKRRAEEQEENERVKRADNGGAESLNLQSQGSFDDQQSDHSDGDKKGEACEENDEKRRARLVRNRESAQLSRQRKKVYVDELEGRLRTMAATVAELNATISHLTADNVNLRRQLGYCYQPPGICPRPGVPLLGPQILPMGPYPGMVGGRPMYPGGIVPPIPIPRLKTQQPTVRISKKSKLISGKEDGGDKKRAKKKVAGAASVAVMSLLCVAMLFSPFDWGFNAPDRIGAMNSSSYTHIGDVRVGGRVLTSWSETGNPVNLTGGNSWEPGPGWVPLEDGEYGPEREGVLSLHHAHVSSVQEQRNEIVESQNIPEVVNMNPFPHTLSSNSTSATASDNQSDCFNAVRVPILMRGGMFPANKSQLFAASVFIPKDNRLVKVDGNLIIQAVMAGDEAAKQSLGKRSKGGMKKGKVDRTSPLVPTENQVMKAVSTKALDGVTPREVKVTEKSTRALVAERALAENHKAPFSTSNPVTPVLRSGSLQQWVLGGLHALKNNTANKMNKKETIQPPIDNSKAVAATPHTPYALCSYAAVSRGPLHSWVLAGLSTEPLLPNGNVSCKKEIIAVLIKSDERSGTSLPPLAGLPLNPVQQFGKKAHDVGFCSLPSTTFSKLYWAAPARTQLADTDSQHWLPANRPVLSTGMCTELFQFDTSPTTVSPEHNTSSEAQGVAENIASETAQGSAHNITSKFSVPRSRRDPFAVPLPPMRSKISTSGEEGKNGTDPAVEQILREQIHSRNLQDGTSSMVVSVLVGPEEYVDSRRKGGKRVSRIFVVVLVDSQKYVTYSCVLPSGGPPRVVAA